MSAVTIRMNNIYDTRSVRAYLYAPVQLSADRMSSVIMPRTVEPGAWRSGGLEAGPSGRGPIAPSRRVGRYIYILSLVKVVGEVHVPARVDTRHSSIYH